MSSSAKEKIIVAIDVPTTDNALQLFSELQGTATWVKIGLQLFTAEGPSIVAKARDHGFRVFLDLKFHDIPNTAKHAVASARNLGVDMTTIHLCGGAEMIRAAVSEAGDMLVLGVSVLTSMDDAALQQTGVSRVAADQVLHLAGLGVESGLKGIVASPLEISALRENFGDRLKLVIPGVRPPGADKGDQKRVLTPAEAISRGADWLVIGRPITGAASPRQALEEIAVGIEAGA